MSARIGVAVLLTALFMGGAGLAAAGLLGRVVEMESHHAFGLGLVYASTMLAGVMALGAAWVQALAQDQVTA